MKKILILMIFLFLLTGCKKKDNDNSVDPEDALIIVQKHDVFGLINSDGAIVKPLQYDQIEYCGSYHIVREDDMSGMLDTFGKEIVPMGDYEIMPAYAFCPSEIVPLEKSMLIPFKSENDLYGFINFDGEKVIPAQFDLATGFFDTGLAPIKFEGKWGYINKDGEVLIEEKYDEAFLFNENGLATVTYHGKYGMIDTAGETVIDFLYTDMGVTFTNGLIFVEDNDKYGFINAKGEEVVEVKYDSVRAFQNGFAVVELDGKFGYVDTVGDIAIDIKFDNALDFTEGLAPVTKDELTGFINTEGVIAIGYEYSWVSYFNSGFATVINEEGLEGVIQKSGDFLIRLSDQQVYPFENGMFLIKDGLFYGYADSDGEIRVGFEYDSAKPFGDNGLARVGNNGKYGLTDKNGNLVVPIQYTDIILR